MTTGNNIQLVSVEPLDGALLLAWSDGLSSRYDFMWLRDNCPSTLHPDTRERTFDLLSVTQDIHPLQMEVVDGDLTIHWSEGEHHSQFDGQWLREHAYAGELRPPIHHRAKSWDAQFKEDIHRGSYQDLVADEPALYQWMRQLDQDGLILVENMPSNEQALNDVAHRIDYQRQTNFGVTFEVRSEPNPINLAYTALALPLHTDLPNQETPPGYQFLHCLVNETDGGESVFADGLKVLEDMRLEEPAYFELLATVAIPFRFHDQAHDIWFHHPVINLDHQGNIVELKYNAHIATTFDLPEAVMSDYYRAYRDLMGRLRRPQYRLEYRLQAGEMVVFDNRRVLHGRTAFEPNGKRHLRGCYVDRTEFQSRLRVLARDHGSVS